MSEYNFGARSISGMSGPILPIGAAQLRDGGFFPIPTVRACNKTCQKDFSYFAISKETVQESFYMYIVGDNNRKYFIFILCSSMKFPQLFQLADLELGTNYIIESKWKNGKHYFVAQFQIL